MNKTQTRRTFIVIVGPSHAGKFLLLYPFQQEPRFGITDMLLWPNTIVAKFFKDALGLTLANPNEEFNIPELDNNVLMNFNIDPFITEYLKDMPQEFRYYSVLVNSNYMNTIPKRLNNPLHIYIPMVRDPRVLWIVDRSTEDKESMKFAKIFFNSMKDFTEAYKKYIVDKDRVGLIHFEKLIKDYSQTIKDTILYYTDFRFNANDNLRIERPSQRINEFFTTDDRDNNKWFGYKNQEALDRVSEVCAEYIEMFGYKKHLTVDEIYDGVDLK